MEKIISDKGRQLKNIIKNLQNSFSFPIDFPNINKKTLRYYKCNEVYEYGLDFFDNISDCLTELLNYLNENTSVNVSITYRLKTEVSFKMKWEKNLSFGRKFYKACNDMLGVRFIINCSEDELIEKLKMFSEDKECLVINFYEREKTKDDGYRGIHVYFRYNRNCFPVEFQFWTRKDAVLHFYTHEVIYKSKNSVNSWEYSKKLRKWLDNIPKAPDELEIEYINYLYGILNKDGGNDA